ncbi:hypothetical protein Btru_063656, partial [Bulinus truncatus]
MSSAQWLMEVMANVVCSVADGETLFPLCRWETNTESLTQQQASFLAMSMSWVLLCEQCLMEAFIVHNVNISIDYINNSDDHQVDAHKEIRDSRPVTKRP